MMCCCCCCCAMVGGVQPSPMVASSWHQTINIIVNCFIYGSDHRSQRGWERFVYLLFVVYMMKYTRWVSNLVHIWAQNENRLSQWNGQIGIEFLKNTLQWKQHSKASVYICVHSSQQCVQQRKKNFNSSDSFIGACLHIRIDEIVQDLTHLLVDASFSQCQCRQRRPTMNIRPLLRICKLINQTLVWSVCFHLRSEVAR